MSTSIRDRSPLRRDSSSDLEILTNNLNKIIANDLSNIVANNLENTLTDNYSNTMATISQLECNMAKDMLPEYSGGSKNLAYFIKQVESYIDLLKKPEECCLFNKLLFEQVKSKLVGEARDILITSNCNRWSDVKEALLNRFGDPRSEELLVNDLTTCFQKNSESYEQYFERIKNKLQILLEHVSIRTPNNDIRISKENTYTNQALTTFTSGILEPYCSHLMNIAIRTLEQALYECRKYDNHKSHISFMNFMRNKSKPIANDNNKFNKNQQSLPQFRHQHNNNNYIPKYFTPNFQAPKINQNPYFHRNNTQNSFPRGPINIQPRQQVQQRFPTNSEVFGKQSKQPLPTPMSISTRNSFRQPQNYFTPRSRPTFISEELFNTEAYEEEIPTNYPFDENQYYDEEGYINPEEQNDDSQNFQSVETPPQDT